MAGEGEPGKPGERGEPGVRGGGTGGWGGYGGAGGKGGYERNGNGNGNGKNGVITQWVPVVVMVLAVFGFWWASADPRERLNKIETSQFENRKELNEALTALRRESTGVLSGYVTLREHNDLQSRANHQFEALEKTDEKFLTKAQFDAWKTERDIYLANSFLKRIEDLQAQINKLHDDTPSKDTVEHKWRDFDKTNESFIHRIDIINDNMRSLSERIDRQDTPLGKRVDVIDARLITLTDRVLNNRSDKK